MVRLLAILLLGHPTLTESQDIRAGSGTTSQLRERLARVYEQIRSLRAVVYSHRAGDKLVVEAVVAAKGAKRMDSMRHMSCAVNHDVNSYVQAYDGSTWSLFRYLNRRYEVTRRFAANPWLRKIKEHVVFQSLGWWPPDDRTPKGRRSREVPYLTDILRDVRLQEASPAKCVAGVPCRLLEIPGMIRLYVDPRLDVVRQRDHLRRTGGGTETLETRYLFDDFRKCGDGILLPYRIERVFPDKGFHSIHLVQSYEVNTVSDSTFNIEPPPGSLVYDRDTDKWWQVPGGLDAFHNIVERAIEEIPDNRAERSPNDLPILSLAIGFAVGLSTGFGLRTIGCGFRMPKKMTEHSEFSAMRIGEEPRR